MFAVGFVLARRKLVMGGVGAAQARSRVDVPGVVGKRTGNIKAGGATAAAAGVRVACVDMRAVCPKFDVAWRGRVDRCLGVCYGVGLLLWC